MVMVVVEAAKGASLWEEYWWWGLGKSSSWRGGGNAELLPASVGHQYPD
jgi:hypothetical protein